jgi:hypothetical protein
MLLPYGIGLALALWAEGRLRKGVKTNIWTDAELVPLRRRLESPVWIWLLVVIGAVSLVWDLRDVRQFSMLPLLLFPLQTPLRLQQILRLPEKSNGLLHGNKFAPIHSSHWGQVSRDGSPH